MTPNIPPPVIAIDGPAASGKSTIGEEVARRLGFIYFDTGVMYRAVTWAACQRGVPIADQTAVTALAESLQIQIMPPTVGDGRQYTVLVDGQDATWELRRKAVEDHVSQVSKYAGVRRILSQRQRQIASAGRVVMAGRDIGTVVYPEAPLKVYLDASPEERARRRYQQALAQDPSADYAVFLANVRERDQIDSSRAESPLRVADDAIVIRTDDLTEAQVVEAVMRLATERLYLTALEPTT